MIAEPVMRAVSVVGTPINPVSWDDALRIIQRWASERQSRYVCICNVHSVITAQQDPEFNRVVQHSDLNTPDGAPIAMMLRRLGCAGQRRINGPDLMWKHCEVAARAGTSIYLYGGMPDALSALQTRLAESFPGLKIAGAYSPPFRALSVQEDQAIVDTINSSGAGVVWVGLGCPKQEKWMAAHRGRINAVMVGVGAAFDFHAGRLKRAPHWMRNLGLEWMHRLISDPARLWKRYLVTNSMFIALASRQLLRFRWARLMGKRPA